VKTIKGRKPTTKGENSKKKNEGPRKTKLPPENSSGEPFSRGKEELENF